MVRRDSGSANGALTLTTIIEEAAEDSVTLAFSALTPLVAACAISLVTNRVYGVPMIPRNRSRRVINPDSSNASLVTNRRPSIDLIRITHHSYKARIWAMLSPGLVLGDCSHGRSLPTNTIVTRD